jgi:quercetin dioxygenase-like cupin family protein
MESIPWEKVEIERMNEKITRQMMNGEKTTLARVLLTRGAVVPRHFHVNEQFTMILEGCLKFKFDDGKEVFVRAGELLYIPPNVPHAAEATEDTVDIDFFHPRREDWISKDDAYLRTGQPMDSK